MSFYMLDNPNPNTIQGLYPRRGGNKPSGTMIIHTSESILDMIGPDSTAEDCAAFISRRTGHGCYHDIVDSDSIIEMYPFEYETWGDSETNNWACHIAAACRTTDWATMGEAKREGFYRNLAWCAADFVIYMRVAYSIEVPRKRITGEQARNRVPGFCAHGDSGLYRTDPGKDFDWNRFFRYVEEALNGTVPPPNKIEIKDEEMLFLADGGDGKVWIGNGITRWHVPSPVYLEHYRNVGGALKFFGATPDNPAPIHTWNPEVLGVDIESLAANSRFVNQYGTNLSVGEQLGWLDKNLNDHAKNSVPTVTLTEANVQAIAAVLVETLAPAIAKDLAKRLES